MIKQPSTTSTAQGLVSIHGREVTAIVGPSGVLTTLVGTSIAASVTRLGLTSKGPRSAAIVAGDILLSATIKPQLDAAGADFGKLTLVPWSQLTGLDAIAVVKTAVKRSIDTELIVLNWFIDRPDQGHVLALKKLQRIAEEYGVAIVIVVHVDAAIGGKRLQRAVDFFAEQAPITAVHAVVLDISGRHVLVPFKNREGYSTAGVGFRVIERHAPSGLPAATIEWEPLPVMVLPKSAPKLESGRRGRKGNEAAAFLREILSNGPLSADKITAMADSKGIAGITLRRAGERLGIRKSHGTWSLDGVAESQTSMII